MLIDVILALFLIYCGISGYRKGLVMSLMSVLMVVICCLGATAAQRLLAPTVTEYLEPQVARAIEPQIERQIELETRNVLEQAEDTGLTVGGRRMTMGDIVELLERFGLDVEDSLADSAVDALSPAAGVASKAIAHAAVEKLAGALIFFLAFLILFLVLHSVSLALDLVARLPVVRLCNRFGGAVLGVLGAGLALVVAAAILQKSDLLPRELGPLGSLITMLAGAAS